jgi:hypothetical protein
MVVHGTPQVDELQRRVAALMRIQQEMRAQTLVKEFGRLKIATQLPV